MKKEILLMGLLLAVLLVIGCSKQQAVPDEDLILEEDLDVSDDEELVGQASLASLSKCLDSDGGKNYYIRGTVRYGGNSTKSDYCPSKKVLKEYYCKGNRPNFLFAFCSESCESGACMRGG